MAYQCIDGSTVYAALPDRLKLKSTTAWRWLLCFDINQVGQITYALLSVSEDEHGRKIYPVSVRCLALTELEAAEHLHQLLTADGYSEICLATSANKNNIRLANSLQIALNKRVQIIDLHKQLDRQLSPPVDDAVTTVKELGLHRLRRAIESQRLVIDGMESARQIQQIQYAKSPRRYFPIAKITAATKRNRINIYVIALLALL